MNKFYQYALLSEVLDNRMKPQYVFEMILRWIAARVNGDTLERMAGEMLHESWRKQREELSQARAALGI
jgi:hypothetical protein